MLLPPFGAMETSREPSYLVDTAFMAVRIRRPRSVDAVPSSLPIDHMKTLGWLRSRRTRFSNWERPSGFDDIMRVSSNTSIPSSSAAFSNSGVGGLCEVRSELQPISCSFRMRKYCTASGSAAPTPAWSW
jgi:hypothetical protein